MFTRAVRVLSSAQIYTFRKRARRRIRACCSKWGTARSGRHTSRIKCCQGLVQLGYLVLAFDPMGQGERIAYPNASGTDTRLSSVDEEHTHPGKQLLLLGDSASRYQVWDAIRSLDYLAAHPMVD